MNIEKIPPRLIFLANQREILKKYLRSKFEEEDWHGVQDAASDLRDIDSEVHGLEMFLELEKE